MEKVYKLTDLWDNSVRGEEESFALLHKLLYPCLFNYAVKIVKNDDLVDDLLQDVFIKSWRNRLLIGKICNVKTYFYCSVRSMLLSYVQSKQLSTLTTVSEIGLEFIEEDIIISGYIDAKVRISMTAALNILPSRQREIIYMHFHDKLKYSQIAEITGTKYKSVINDVYPAFQILSDVSLFRKCYSI